MWPFGGGSSEASTSAQPQSPQQTRSTAPHPIGPEASADQCPVDEKTRSVWLAQARGSGNNDPAPESSASAAHAFLGRQKARGQVQVASAPPGLSTDRVVSSIPRFSMWQKDDHTSASYSTSTDSGSVRAGEASGSAPTSSSDPSTSKNWVYPSPSQFYNAMARKNHNPRAEDMNTVVPIHNAVNERAWQQILAWEHLAGDGGQSVQQCGGPKLVSFKGRPKDVTWRAWWRSATGYQAPFDRHDWVIDRCGTRVTYVIDFYSGKTQQGSNVAPSLSFYLDVRPSPGQIEGMRMRAVKLLGIGYSQREPSPTAAPKA